MQELIDAVESIVNRSGKETPILMLVGRKAEKSVGNEKGLTREIG
jgi:hypothetical protein